MHLSVLLLLSLNLIKIFMVIKHLILVELKKTLMSIKVVKQMLIVLN